MENDQNLIIVGPIGRNNRMGGKCRSRALSRGWKGVNFPVKKRYEDVRINVTSVTRGCMSIKIPGKRHYVMFTEWRHGG